MFPALWDRRNRVALLATQWVALVLGIFATIASLGPGTAVLGAAGVAGLYVLASTALPLEWLGRSWVLDVVTVSGAILTMTAVTLTGSADSPYLLLAIIPPLWAGLYGGLRIGLATASLSSGLLILVEMSQETPSLPQALLIAGVQLLLAVTVAQVRRLMVDIEKRQTELDQRSVDSDRQLSRLQSTHDLLTRLADVTAGDELNAIALGETAVESLIATRPGSAAAAAIAGEKGPVIVARHGHEPPDPHLANIPLRIGGRDVGWVIISAPTPFTDDELEDFEASLQPLALAFANVKLLQTIVGRAISHERSRIARELHDELGPSLASLGLALDLAMVEHPAEPGLAGRLTELRSNVAELVNDVRLTVSDLRALPSDSLVTALRQEALRAGNGPELRIDIDERRPPRPSMAAEVRAILSEAVRNAVRHADATTVSIAGFVDFDRGRLTVRDDGHGFDVDGISRGHFGLVGMQERAVQIGASLTVESTTTGTEVKIEWEIP